MFNSAFFHNAVRFTLTYFLFVNCVWAISLGEGTARSFLGQPLVVDIPIELMKHERYGESDFIVRIGDREAYSKRGLLYPFSGHGAEWKILTNEDGQLYIQVKSDSTVRDPVVELLLNLEWPKGKLQRQYVFLLDPKSWAISPPTAGVTAPKTSQQTNIPKDSYPSAKPNSSVVFTNGFYHYHIEEGDVISLLAQRFRGNVQLPLNRYINAIIDTNQPLLNRGLESPLYIGQILKIPNPNDVKDGRITSTQQSAPDTNVNSLATDGRRQTYRVQYGDTLSILAQRLRGEAKIALSDYIDMLIQANPVLLDGGTDYLQAGMILSVPNLGQEVIADVTPPVTTQVENEESSQVSEDISSESINESTYSLSQDTDEIENSAPVVAQPIAPNLETASSKPEIMTSISSKSETLKTDTPEETNNIALVNLIDHNLLVNQVQQLQQENLELKGQMDKLLLEYDVLKLEYKQVQENITALEVAKQDIEERLSTTKILLTILLIVLIVIAAAGILLYIYCVRLVQNQRREFNALQNIPWSGTTFGREDEEAITAHTVTPGYNNSECTAQENDEQIDETATTGPDVADQSTQKSAAPSDQLDKIRSDYSNYDFKKSNYDYGAMHDLDALAAQASSGQPLFDKMSSAIEASDVTDDNHIAEVLIEFKQYTEAEEILRNLLENQPKSSHLWTLKLRLHRAQGDLETCEAMIADIKANWSQEEIDKELNHYIEDTEAEIYRSQQQETNTVAEELPLEETVFLNALKRLPKHEIIAEIKEYLSHGLYQLAEITIARLLTIAPNDFDYHLLRLHLLRDIGKIDDMKILALSLKNGSETLSETAIREIDKLLDETDNDTTISY